MVHFISELWSFISIMNLLFLVLHRGIEDNPGTRSIGDIFNITLWRS